MPIEKARQLLRSRKAKEVAHDPHVTEAYESGWYALLAQNGAGTEHDAAAGADPSVADETADEPAGPAVAPPPLLAPVTLVPPSADPSSGPGRRDTTPPTPDRRGDPPASVRPGRSDPASIRIGVRRLDDPARVYLDYLTVSRHRDFFRAEWWPATGSITPVHLWRANHLGAAWDVDSIDRFMEDAAVLADELVASAPRSAPAGSPERRAWQARFVAAGWVREFGVGRISKTLHPMLPELVADLDPAMMAWARPAWFGLTGPADAEDPELWLELTELLEDVLVLRAHALGQIARRLRRAASGIAPVSRLGPVLAALWESYWAEPPEAGAPAEGSETPAPRRRARRSSTATPRAGAARATSATSRTKSRASRSTLTT